MFYLLLSNRAEQFCFFYNDLVDVSTLMNGYTCRICGVGCSVIVFNKWVFCSLVGSSPCVYDFCFDCDLCIK